MDKRVKDALGLLLVILVAISVYAIATFATSYSKSIDPSSLRSFNVSAEGEVVAIPDIGQFTFSVITEGGEELLELQQENTEAANAVISFLKEEGVDEKDIKTVNYSVDPRRTFFNGPMRPEGEPIPPPEIVGFAVRQTIQVKVRDLPKAGDLLAGVVSNGANTVSQLSFEVDDIEAVQNQARARAVAAAREKAAVLARAGGFRVGDVLSINEGRVFLPFRGSLNTTDESTGTDRAPMVEPGSQEVRVTVTVTYEIR